jgi:hypothetical protein
MIAIRKVRFGDLPPASLGTGPVKVQIRGIDPQYIGCAHLSSFQLGPLPQPRSESSPSCRVQLAALAPNDECVHRRNTFPCPSVIARAFASTPPPGAYQTITVSVLPL